ncbi:MAG: hypothetical protein KME11_05950 [Timaviella obliquedivisa GSE-PSE-MK23-08B]|jgi:hypothetical protein|nr:hypothetical protein [Timaviella obliquedivisa GSE-PSE-MK23-08B]
MSKVAVVTIHGMGNTPETYADELRNNLQAALAPEWNQISFQSVYYQTLLQGNQSRVFENMKRHISGKLLREFLLYGFSDAASLESSRGEAKGAYAQAQMQVISALRQVYAELEGQPAKVVIIAQSLGGQVLSNYIWDAQHPGRSGVWRNIAGYVNVDTHEQSFLELKSLYRLFTTGCNIPIFVAGHGNIQPIAPPTPDFRWFNFYDADDVLGWPLQPLSAAYEQLVEDIPVNAGRSVQGWLTSWNPLSHGNYWSDRGFLEALVIEIRRGLR